MLTIIIAGWEFIVSWRSREGPSKMSLDKEKPKLSSAS
jgi:hypothetical protein